ncbi:MAG: aldo/keto reductase [Defluviitaleaceae bacterium]|nr:aldo/keto reductase [Defluviitaleaceae bacterium]MCL2238720.1 aldo/keto reductase [Defluviitaleaceae bacterium]
MKYTTLNNGVVMPMLGMGTYGLAQGPECVDAVKYAINGGYRSIDTACAYGNEASVGQAIRESGIPRSEIFLTTKLWNEDQRGGDVAGAMDSSLAAMGLDYVDLYIIHWPCKGHYSDAWLALEKIYKAGKARAIGVSNFQAHHIEKIKKRWTVVPALNQIEMHPYLTQKPLIAFCRGESIAPQSWSPLGGNGPLRQRIFESTAIAQICEKYNKTPAQVILRWNMDLGIIAIPKSGNPGRMDENFNIFDFALAPEEIAALDALNQDHRGGPDPDDFNF